MQALCLFGVLELMAWKNIRVSSVQSKNKEELISAALIIIMEKYESLE